MLNKYSPTIRVRCVIINAEQILLCRLTSRAVAFLPGGRVEPEENLMQATKREILEETGSATSKLDYLGAIEHLWYEDGSAMHDLNHYFAAECPNLSTDTIPVCDDQGVELFWVKLDELEHTPLQPPVLKQFIRNYVAGSTAAWWSYVCEEQKIFDCTSS